MSSKFYNGSTHIFYADDGGDVTLKAGNGNLIIEGFANSNLPSLTSGQIFIGNDDNEATSRPLSGSVQFVGNTGQTKLSNIITPDTYNNISSLTVNEEGRISSIVTGDGTVPLLNTQILIGQVDGKGAGKSISGDISLTNTGLVTLNNVSTGGDYYYPTKIQIDNKGRVLQASETDVNETQILIGQSNNKLLPRMMSGHATIDKFGVVSLSNTVTAGTTTYLKGLTWNDQGRITQIQNLEGSLGDSQFLIGYNGGTQVKPVAMSGSIVMDTNGVTSLASLHSGYTLNFPTSIVVNTSGQITSLSNTGHTNGTILIGNAGNQSIARVINGDLSISNVGTATLSSVSNATPSKVYEYPKITADVKGRILTIEEGKIEGMMPNNLLLNSHFQVWLRRPQKSITNISNGLAVGIDKWIFKSPDVNQTIAELGITDNMGGNYFRLIRQAGSTSTGAILLGNPMLMSHCKSVVGKKVTMGVKIRKSADNPTTSINLIVVQGTGSTEASYLGSTAYTNPTTILNQSINISTSWTEHFVASSTTFTGTMMCPHISWSPPSGTAVGEYLEFEYVVLYAGENTVVRPVTQPNYNDELLKLRPFFSYFNYLTGVAISATSINFAHSNDVYMRITNPTISAGNTTTGTVGGAILRVYDPITATYFSQSSLLLSTISSTEKGFVVNAGNFTGLTTGTKYILWDSAGVTLRTDCDLS